MWRISKSCGTTACLLIGECWHSQVRREQRSASRLPRFRVSHRNLSARACARSLAPMQNSAELLCSAVKSKAPLPLTPSRKGRGISDSAAYASWSRWGGQQKIKQRPKPHLLAFSSPSPCGRGLGGGVVAAHMARTGLRLRHGAASAWVREQARAAPSAPTVPDTVSGPPCAGMTSYGSTPPPSPPSYPPSATNTSSPPSDKAPTSL